MLKLFELSEQWSQHTLIIFLRLIGAICTVFACNCTILQYKKSMDTVSDFLADMCCKNSMAVAHKDLELQQISCD